MMVDLRLLMALAAMVCGAVQAQPHVPAAQKVAAPKDTAQTPAPQAVRLLRDQPYGSDPRQRFDVYLPARPTGPVLFLVHGGAWAVGDKAAPGMVDAKVRHWVAGAGYVLVSTNYRMLPKARPLEQAADVARSLARVQQLAAGWGADPARVAVMGHSAGAHLAMLLNAKPSLATAQGAKPWRAVVALDSAAYDLEPLMRAPHAPLYDRAFGADPAYWQAASPYHVMEPGAANLLMVCSMRRPGVCDDALHYERKASKFKHYVTIWQQDLSHADISRALGRPGIYTDNVSQWLAAALKP